jgi:hypothetical protein
MLEVDSGLAQKELEGGNVLAKELDQGGFKKQGATKKVEPVVAEESKEAQPQIEQLPIEEPVVPLIQ